MKTHSLFNVFLVDDDSMFRMAMEKHLTDKLKRLIRIRTFPDGETFLKYLHQNPDLILLDYHFGDGSENALNGIDLLGGINAACPETPVVMISGKGTTDIIVEAMRKGAVDFIEKNEESFRKTAELIQEALQYFPDRKRHFKSGKKNLLNTVNGNQVHRPTRIFFAPITLPDPALRKITSRKKKALK
ncbi:MAG: response regulator [Bacteroidia bacterium]